MGWLYLKLTKMKSRIILASVIIAFSQVISAQNIDDALRYSQTIYQGTARFNGMSGAFTALGGDMSAIPLNPAAAALFRSTEFSVTPQLFCNKVNTTFTASPGFTSKTSDFTSKTGLGQIGIVSVMNTGTGSGLNGLAISYTYNRTNNFDLYSTINGTHSNTSMADYWAAIANGTTKNYLGGDASLAESTWLIDTLSGSSNQYASTFSYYGDEASQYGQSVERIISNSGHQGEHTIALGANIGDKLYIGASLGLAEISYTGHYEHSEYLSSGDIYGFYDFTYVNHFDAEGNGANFKFGLIFRPIESLRLGFSMHTPTVYNMNETFYSSITSEFDSGNHEASTGTATYSYKLKTPGRVNTGVAYQIGTSAIISADYEFVDYSSAKLKDGADGYAFASENSDIKSELQSASNLRLGGEYHIGSLYFRGGYSYYGSAFKNGTLNEDRHYSGYSLGLGYRQKPFYIDFAYSELVSTEQYMMYSDSYLDPATIKSNYRNFSATVGIKF
jgi:hypothetical protein